MCLYAVPDALAQGTCRFIIFSLKNKQKLFIAIFFIMYCRGLFTDMFRSLHGAGRYRSRRHIEVASTYVTKLRWWASDGWPCRRAA